MSQILYSVYAISKYLYIYRKILNIKLYFYFLIVLCFKCQPDFSDLNFSAKVFAMKSSKPVNQNLIGI